MEKVSKVGPFWFTVSLVLLIKLVSTDVEIWVVQKSMFWGITASVVVAAFSFAINNTDSKKACNKAAGTNKKKNFDEILVIYSFASCIAFGIWLFAIFLVNN